MCLEPGDIQAKGDTVVQYAAYLTPSSLWRKGDGYHSILITLARQAVQSFFVTVSSAASSFQRTTKDTTNHKPSLQHQSKTPCTVLSYIPSKDIVVSPAPYLRTLHYANSSLLAYMISVLIVSLVPLRTSSPACKRLRCWKSRTRPYCGTTSIRSFMFREKKVVAPPFKGSCPFSP